MGQYQVWMDDEGIIRCSITGMHDRNDAENLTNEVIKLASGKERVRVLFDLREIEGTSAIARRIHIDTIKNKPDIFEKVALFGNSSLSKVLANFIITGVDQMEDIRYFVNLKDAIEWLKE